MLNYFLKFYKKTSIKQKLLLLFSIQIIIPLIFMGVMLYRNTKMIIQKKSITYAIDTLKMVELRINDFSKNVIDISEDLLYDTDVYKALNDHEHTNKDLSYYTTRVHTNNLLRKICLSRKEIQSIALISKNKTFYTYDLNSGRASLEDVIPYDAILHTARIARQKPVWFSDKDIKGNIKNLYLIRMIYDVDNFNEAGLMAICINREFLKSSYSEFSTEFMQDINILSKDNVWITGTMPYTKNQFASLLKIDNDNKYDYVIDKENNVLLAYMKVNNGEWVVTTRSSLSKLNEELDRFRLMFTMVIICTILILSIFSILMAMDIIDPINRLVDGIKKVEEENVHQEVVVDRSDELGYLSKCFNKMTKEIDILVNRVYKEQLTRKEAELKALQAQINPHFLFNTLESINWMAQLNNVPEIRDMVTSLGSIMEASIGKGNPLISLKQELKYIDSYILIMKNRYGDRLTYESDIDETVLGAHVPKLLLQPLVENAIYHGVDRMRKKGEIKLTIKKDENTIHIEVRDNGKGIEKEELVALNKKFEEVNDDYLLMRHRKGIGLENVNGRIKLFFGQQYGLTIESEYESYTKIKLTIPVNY
ncbi:cache domain-containing sensor histidine kinase [Cellulosilyticum sp. I15G10I2]|uniref:cache domain-containing sensor histidine kinase n=1 Tax=Cellulosilyticum sp. I15G10I2 TaxID=1892843 RepID=UPI00085CD5AF|nr:sensor histidine kinase [Cellulosilyticum sp. I15G10I2]